MTKRTQGWAFFGLSLGLLAHAAACGNAGTPQNSKNSLPSGVFGGAAGVIEPKLDASTQEAGMEEASTGIVEVCGSVPQGHVALLDDFDDHDSLAVPEADREAYWYPVHDDSAGMMNQPNE